MARHERTSPPNDPATRRTKTALGQPFTKSASPARPTNAPFSRSLGAAIPRSDSFHRQYVVFNQARIVRRWSGETPSSWKSGTKARAEHPARRKHYGAKTVNMP